MYLTSGYIPDTLARLHLWVHTFQRNLKHITMKIQTDPYRPGWSLFRFTCQRWVQYILKPAAIARCGGDCTHFFIFGVTGGWPIFFWYEVIKGSQFFPGYAFQLCCGRRDHCCKGATTVTRAPGAAARWLKGKIVPGEATSPLISLGAEQWWLA